MLSPGAKIAAISPSGIIRDRNGLRQGIELIESWGYHVVLSPHHDNAHLYTAGTKQQRTADLHWAIQDPSIELIWCIRGGYGSAQLLDSLDDLKITKPLLGFSDATALLAYLWNTGQPYGYHSPVLHSVATLCDSHSQGHLHHWLTTGALPKMKATHFFGPSEEIEGPLVGGNLCILASLCGTKHQLQTEGCILALEDIAEPAYKIDRMLLQLELSGMFAQLKGILLGSFHKCHPPTSVSWTLRDVFRERLESLNVPVFHNANFGHDEVNWIWKSGMLVRLAPNVF